MYKHIGDNTFSLLRICTLSPTKLMHPVMCCTHAVDLIDVFFILMYESELLWKISEKVDYFGYLFEKTDYLG